MRTSTISEQILQLLEIHGGLSPAELQEKLQVSRATIHNHLRKLEQMKEINRFFVPRVFYTKMGDVILGGPTVKEFRYLKEINLDD